MILTGNEIQLYIKKKYININPFLKSNLNPNSYNYRLGNYLIEFDEEVIDMRNENKKIIKKIPESGFLLMPNKLYLASTLEKIASKYFVISLIGRSSLGRLGLFLQITADLGQIGCNGNWTLELKTVQPLKIYPKMKIGQVTFWKPEGKIQLYNGKYKNQNLPQSSKIYQELKNDIDWI